MLTSCGKNAYATRNEALLGVKRALTVHSKRKIRVYFCSDCLFFHLTSQTDNQSLSPPSRKLRTARFDPRNDDEE